MSRLDDLLQTLCPDGVEYKELAELAEIGTGNSNRVDANDEGKYPFFVRSKQVMRSNKYDFDEEAIVIPGEGGIGEIFHYVHGKYDLHQRAYRISFRDSRVNTRFAYYFMMANFKKFITMKAVTATVVSIRMPMIASFLLPLPPLPVQEEIVRILDTFSGVVAELEQKLEAEQAARTKQYEHYREELFDFSDNQSVNIEKWQEYYLSEVCTISNGRDHKTLNDGNIPVFGSGGIMRYVDQSLYSNESVLIPRKGSIGNIFYVNQPFWVVDTIFYTKINKDKVNPKYLYYFLVTQHLEKLNMAGGVPSLTKSMLDKVLIPIPLMTVQNDIVSILDRFDTLVNDLKSGLPAEIALRRKQYEYYRDKLLNFKPLE